MSSIEHFNKVKNFSLSSSFDVAYVMLPILKRHGMTIFNYCREYKDGSQIRLSTHGQWNEQYFKGYIHNAKVPSAYLIKPINYFIWLTKDWPEMMIDVFTNFNIGNGISIAESHEDFIECFAFGADANNSSIINNFYLNNLDLLQQYSHYFKEKADLIIKKSVENKIPPCEIEFKNDFPLLQTREIQCAKLLLKGKSYKEIGAALHLSHRTIEDYLNSLKCKFKVRNKSEPTIKLLSFPQGMRYYSTAISAQKINTCLKKHPLISKQFQK